MSDERIEGPDGVEPEVVPPPPPETETEDERFLTGDGRPIGAERRRTPAVTDAWRVFRECKAECLGPVEWRPRE